MSSDLSAVDALLKEALQLNRNDTVLIIYQSDPDYISLHNEIERKAKNLKIKTRNIPFIPSEAKENHISDIIDEIKQYPDPPAGIALLIDRNPEKTDFRLELLKQLSNATIKWRIASLPGVTYDRLINTKIDFIDIVQRSKQAFLALAVGEEVVLESKNQISGGIDILRIPIRKQIPMLSTGLLAMSTWGNFPSGECFILPEPWKSEGHITIDGSIPFTVLPENSWIRLKVTKGRVVLDEVESSHEHLKEKFLEMLLDENGSQLCEFNNSVAEFGIGTNKGINELTGLPIFDEKKLGTFHIGIGSNKQFRGDIKSKYHNDLVIKGNAKCTIVSKAYPKGYNVIEDSNFTIPYPFETMKDFNLDTVPMVDFYTVEKNQLKLIGNKTLCIAFHTLRDNLVKIFLDLDVNHYKILEKIVKNIKFKNKKYSLQELMNNTERSDRVAVENCIKLLTVLGYLKSMDGED